VDHGERFEGGGGQGLQYPPGVNVAPAYGPSQHVRAWFEICKDPSPPSKDETTQNPPAPLPAPVFDAVNEPGEQISINTIVNGAAVTVLRNGVNLGTYGCWGGRLILAVSPKISAVDVFTATQQMCPGDPPSPPGTGKAIPCSSLGAPKIGPVQSGDTHITVAQCALGATIKVWVNGSHVASGPGPIVPLGGTVLKLGDTIHVVQDLFNCKGQTALEVKVACVDPPTTGNPAWLNLFPVGHADYSDGGGVKGTVYYPAEDDGKDQAFNKLSWSKIPSVRPSRAFDARVRSVTCAGVSGGCDHVRREEGADKDASPDRHATRSADNQATSR
jgi:hypothetical protein